MLHCVAVCCSQGPTNRSHPTKIREAVGTLQRVLQCVTECCSVFQSGDLLIVATPYNLRGSAHTATHCNRLHHTTTHSCTLQHTATLWNILQHSASQCNTPSRQCSLRDRVVTRICVTHCDNTLQHTATRFRDSARLESWRDSCQDIHASDMTYSNV